MRTPASPCGTSPTPICNAESRPEAPAIAGNLIGLTSHTVTESLVWRRVFETNQSAPYAGAYHLGWFASLAGHAAIGVEIMAGRWKDCRFFVSALSGGAFHGREDAFYYPLDRRPMPSTLQWLDATPLVFDISGWA